ncbi:hypothetical protein BOX15_Mlig025821g1 [Macrostomum lignano]|uniref:JmjC domain-containing protein n=2 Tax=Macrostomum lignano TaxID=282301 RepID=A0A1I8G4J6_9PLAT|nr:hypothetical protein BOX15_Mlig025821g1 [Macrostomum lignano]
MSGNNTEAFCSEVEQLLASLPRDGGLISQAAARQMLAEKLLRKQRNLQMPIGVWTVLALLTAGLVARAAYRSSSPTCLLSGTWLQEIARQPSNCSSMCAGLTSVPVETDISPERFLQLYAYTGRPLLVRNGTRGWRAHQYFSYEFIRDLHDRHPSAYGHGPNIKVIDPFNVELATLHDALHMSEERRRRPFYFGWKNLNRGVCLELMNYHERPYYLGPEIEHPAADWFYIGSASRAALLHIDFFYRPSWQAQIAGRKRWILQPPVECESVCSPLQVDIEPGDILNVDPNQWYHATYVLNETFSITLGSEFM